MAKVRFYCDSGANIHSCRKSGVLDTVKDLKLVEWEWEQLDEDTRFELAEVWANERLSIGYEEVDG